MQSISIKWKIVGGQDTGNRWRTCLRNVLETLVGGGHSMRKQCYKSEGKTKFEGQITDCWRKLRRKMPRIMRRKP